MVQKAHAGRQGLSSLSQLLTDAETETEVACSNNIVKCLAHNLKGVGDDGTPHPTERRNAD